MVTLKINGMHCTSCSLNIDGELEELAGIYSAQTSYAKSETKVDYDPEKIKPETFRKTIEKLGYSLAD